MTDRAHGVADPLAWWQDKQVAVVVGMNIVRGWVLAVSPNASPAAEGAPIGHLTIVLFIGSATLAGQYPSEVTVVVQPGGPHGRPHRVLGPWTEGDLADVRAHRTLTRGSLEQVQTIHGNQRLAPA